MAIVKFWGGKLDGIEIDTLDNEKSNWLLHQLMKEMDESDDAVGALYYHGEHYIIKTAVEGQIALSQTTGELFALLQQIKDRDFPEDTAYFF